MVNESDVARGFDALFNKIESDSKRDIRKREIAEEKANKPDVSTHQSKRHAWLCELADQMKQFNMDTTGCPELDRAISERN